ncbi:hypothetical protein KZZ20_01085 [Methylacidiphilum fumariolicum]|uniref:calcium:proton antiporter n=1 Tax=Candidatus Methylacidiphilum fumarolicum TaxID=591154 RepID=UPI001CA5C8D7|nr:hypothetical protein [Candidatus Methylacidiphilum fumarolicum]MBW6414123.1 hypothetical protein [Candidatus Methylacidiphilum fumarolicum]
MLPIRKSLWGKKSTLLFANKSVVFSIVSLFVLLFFVKGRLSTISNFQEFLISFFWFFSLVLANSFVSVKHAEKLAKHYGEPYGSLILTFAATAIEFSSIWDIMSSGENLTFARDTIYSVIMIILGGMIGTVLLVGGIYHKEQKINLEGARAFISVIVPLAVLILILPNFTRSTPGPIFSKFQTLFYMFACLFLYLLFLVVQTVRHRKYFFLDEMEANPLPREKIDPKASFPLYHVLMLVVSLLFVVFFAEKLAFPIEYAIEKMKAPKVVGGFLIALLVLLPESLTAIEAAICNGLQRSVNILLGSVCATIGLTLPLILAFSLLKSSSLILGLGQVEATLLVLTLLLCQITFSGGKTNILQGAVHLLLFFSYLIMMFD